MIDAINIWAESNDVDVVAQIGPSTGIFPAISTKDFYSPRESIELFSKAEIIVSHAGMGSILTACELGKTLIILPRKFDLGEHRNDHQLATAKKFESLNNVFVATDVEDLVRLLSNKVILTVDSP
jgi:UDP-N-acetylglucosamine transferase subunit ALG13